MVPEPMTPTVEQMQLLAQRQTALLRKLFTDCTREREQLLSQTIAQLETYEKILKTTGTPFGKGLSAKFRLRQNKLRSYHDRFMTQQGAQPHKNDDEELRALVKEARDALERKNKKLDAEKKQTETLRFELATARKEIETLRAKATHDPHVDSNALVEHGKQLQEEKERRAQELTAMEAKLRAKFEKEKEEMVDAMALELEETEKEHKARMKQVKEAAAVAAAARDKKWKANDMQRLEELHASLKRLQAQCKETKAVVTSQSWSSLRHGLLQQVTESTRRYTRQLGTLQDKYQREYDQRKKLFNLVQELRGNIRVFCRCRPPTPGEMQSGDTHSEIVVTFPDTNEIEYSDNVKRHKRWEFDHVFRPDSTQTEIYARVSPLITSVLDGYNVCIFAYGQTGTGKTHTMTGPGKDPGVNQRALRELFSTIEATSDEFHTSVSISILEIYNEQIVDLLSEEVEEEDDNDDQSLPGTGNGKLQIKQGPHGMHVPGLTERTVASLEHVLQLISTGERNRAQTCTNMNEHSSRSHLIITLTVSRQSRLGGSSYRGKLHLIDLAGSERLSKSGATGRALKEAQSINKSLSALGDVIAARANKHSHVPYRNSTLTYLLQDSLKQDAKTLMLVCVSPARYNLDESFCSLNFAARVATVTLGPAIRHKLPSAGPPGPGSGSSSNPRDRRTH